MAGADHVVHTVNAGLYSVESPDHFSGPVEGDLWYNNTEGHVRTRVSSFTSKTGPGGTIPEIYGLANGWYSAIPGSGNEETGVVTNNRAYAYPIYPGRKCTLADFAVRIYTTPGTGNLRMMLYGALATGLPGALIADYGTKTGLTANTTISGWTVGTALQPAPYWVVLAAQTSVAPTMYRHQLYSPLIPELSATPPTAVTPTLPTSALYTDTGFSGAPPGTFGAASSLHVHPPMLYCKITQ